MSLPPLSSVTIPTALFRVGGGASIPQALSKNTQDYTALFRMIIKIRRERRAPLSSPSPLE